MHRPDALDQNFGLKPLTDFDKHLADTVDCAGRVAPCARSTVPQP